MADSKMLQLTEQVSQLTADIKMLVEVNKAQQDQIAQLLQQRSEIEKNTSEFFKTAQAQLDSLQWIQYYAKNLNTKIDIMEYRQCQASPMPSDAQRMVDQESSGAKWGNTQACYVQMAREMHAHKFSLG